MCSDRDRNWFPQRAICWATANQAAAARFYDQLHEDVPFHDGSFTNWSKSASRDTPYRFDDGVTIWVALDDHAPDDDFLEWSLPEVHPHDDGEVIDGGDPD